MDTQSNTFVQKSAGLRGITADEVSELTGIIQSGPWHSDQQSRIVLALTTIMSDGDADADANHGRRKNQDLEHFYNWLTSDEGSTLSNTNDMRLKIATALDVLDRIKATLLSQNRSVTCVSMASSGTTLVVSLLQETLRSSFQRPPRRHAHPYVPRTPFNADR